MGCWAHLRWKFYDALAPDSTSNALSNQLLEEIDELFKLENDWKTLSLGARLLKRQRVLTRNVNQLFWKFSHYKKHLYNQSGLFYTALNYTLNHKTHFYAFLEDGRLEMSHNAAERSIKSLVIGRKNQLFATSMAGAQAGGILLTLIETAKRHQLEPQSYLTYLLTHLPNESNALQPDMDCYLPWSDTVQQACRPKQLNQPTN